MIIFKNIAFILILPHFAGLLRRNPASGRRDSPPAAGHISGIFLTAAVRSTQGVFRFIGSSSYETKNRPGRF